MTVALLLANSPAIEIRNMMNQLVVGNPARYTGFTGEIDFVDTTQLIICDDHYCISIPTIDWMEVEVEPAVKQYSKSFKSTVEDHPGNDMLPGMNLR
jgi:hypothetical protein